MSWITSGAISPSPIQIEAEAQFYEAEKRNREAVIQARLSNRRMRANDEGGQNSAIDDLVRKLDQKERAAGK